MQLSCPVCKIPFTERAIGGASYHACEEHGVWATVGFFSRFKNLRSVAGNIFHSRMFLKNTGEEPLPCPQCFQKMKATEYKKVPGLILDQCFFCNGIWFDKGELNAIPQKAELEKDFNYQPLTRPVRTEGPARAKVMLNDGLPEDPHLTPMMYLGLPAEETQRAGSGVSAAAVGLAILCIIFSMKGFRSEEFFKAWAFYPQDPLRANGLTLFTSLFLHGSLWHLISNIYFLYVTSDNVEEVKGPYFVLGLFFIAGLAGKFVYAASGSTWPSIGASGGICGVMAYYPMTFPHNRVRLLRPFARYRHHHIHRSPMYVVKAQHLLFFYLAIQAAYYFMAQAGHMRSKTNFLAHVAGLAVGLIAHVLTADHSKSNPS